MARYAVVDAEGHVTNVIVADEDFDPGRDFGFSKVESADAEPGDRYVADVLVKPPVVGVAPFPNVISDRQFAHALKNAGVITHAEALAFVATGTIPAQLAAFVAAIKDQEQREAAELLLAGATAFHRQHPMTLAIAAGLGWTDAQVDSLWYDAAEL